MEAHSNMQYGRMAPNHTKHSTVMGRLTKPMGRSPPCSPTLQCSMTWVLWICSHKLLLTTSLVQSNCLGCHQQLISGANVRVGIVTARCTAVGNVLPGRHKFPNLLQTDNRVHTLSNNKITSHIVFYLSNHKVLFYHQGNW
jgi:hypothetical protein